MHRGDACRGTRTVFQYNSLNRSHRQVNTDPYGPVTATLCIIFAIDQQSVLEGDDGGRIRQAHGIVLDSSLLWGIISSRGPKI